ncbi:hypothetical protein ScPMuIL_018761 [Solemya velum]
MHLEFIFALAVLACIVTVGHSTIGPKGCKAAYFKCKDRGESWCHLKRTLCMVTYCKELGSKASIRRCFFKYVLTSALRGHLPVDVPETRIKRTKGKKTTSSKKVEKTTDRNN